MKVFFDRIGQFHLLFSKYKGCRSLVSPAVVRNSKGWPFVARFQVDAVQPVSLEKQSHRISCRQDWPRDATTPWSPHITIKCISDAPCHVLLESGKPPEVKLESNHKKEFIVSLCSFAIPCPCRFNVFPLYLFWKNHLWGTPSAGDFREIAVSHTLNVTADSSS